MQNEILAQASLEFAKTELGKKEATGNNDGPFVNMIQEWFAGVSEHGASWCALFATWCIYQTAAKLGIKPVLPKSESSSYLYSYGKVHGLLLTKPIPHCLGLMKGDGGTAGKTHHHTFRVISVDADLGIVHGLDGNWGNQVALTTHRIKDCDFVAVA